MTKKILIIDDSPTMREMVSVALEGTSFKAVTATDGIDALRIADTDNFDAIITDINMPGMGGIEFIQQVRAKTLYKYTPILVLTTEAGDEVKQRGKAAGATGWILKPFSPQTLLAALNKVCGVQ